LAGLSVVLKIAGTDEIGFFSGPVGVSLDPYKTFAEHAESTMKGFGTDELGLSAALVRFRPFLQEVSKEYQRIYSKSLKDRVKGETSGDYRALLVGLLDSPANA
jgi:hypothetical protein